jgi:hypothetical protein
MSWLEPSHYWARLTLKKKSDLTIVEKILLDLFYKKNTNYNEEWLKPSAYWNTLLQKNDNQLTRIESILLDVYMRKHTQYKCKFGTLCTYKQCTYRHPNQSGYKKALYVLNKKPCVYESETTCCKKKCSNELGMYCIYEHCTHLMSDVIHCIQEDCQGHCKMCI